MKVELSENLSKAIEALVDKGEYESPEAVVEATVTLLEERDRLYWSDVSRKIDEARRDFEAGRFRRVDDVDAYISELRAEVHRRAATVSG